MSGSIESRGIPVDRRRRPIASIAALVFAIGGIVLFATGGACSGKINLVCSLDGLLAFRSLAICMLAGFIAAAVSARRGEPRLLVLLAFLATAPMLLFIAYSIVRPA